MNIQKALKAYLEVNFGIYIPVVIQAISFETVNIVVDYVWTTEIGKMGTRAYKKSCTHPAYQLYAVYTFWNFDLNVFLS